MGTKKKVVILGNYSEREVACECGCGLMPSDTCMIAHQAFHDSLERKYGRRVRHTVSGPARCRKHNDELIRRGIKAEKGSRHLHDALDGVWELEARPGKWEQIPNEDIARQAIRSGLFGGVGYKIYPSLGKNLVHLDTRSGGEIDIW